MISKIINNIEKKMAIDDNITAALTDIYGSKNLLPSNPANVTTEFRGITYTINNDGTITATGTAYADNESNYFIYNRTDSLLSLKLVEGNEYILTGIPSGAPAGCHLRMYSNLRSWSSLSDNGEGFKFIPQTGEVFTGIVITIDKSVQLPNDGILIKPMLRDTRITDDTYVPYCMNNMMLMNNKLNYSDQMVVIGSKIPSDENEIVTNIINWVVNNKFVGEKPIEYYGSFNGFLISTKESSSIYNIIIINNGSGKIYCARFAEDKTRYGAFKFTGTVL